MANMLKVVDGGWLPLAIAASVGLTMATWLRGSRILQRRTRKTEADLDWLIRKLEAKPPHRVPGTAVFLTSDINSAPTSLMHNLKHNRILHERNIVLSIKTNDVPRVLRSERVEIDRLNETFVKVIAHYGFMETPSIPKIFEQCRRKALNVDVSPRPSSYRDALSGSPPSPKCRAGKICFSSGWPVALRMRQLTSVSRPIASSKLALRSRYERACG